MSASALLIAVAAPPHHAQDRDLIGVHRLHGLVLGLQADAAVLAEEPLDGRLVIADQRHDDLAVAGVGLLLDDHQVARQDAGVDHALALDGEQEVGIRADLVGNRDVILDHLLGQSRSACGDLADQGQNGRPAILGRHLHRDPLPRAAALDHLERARLRRVAADQPRGLQAGKMRVHRGRRCQADSLADLAHGRGIPVRVDVLVDELEDLLLPL